MARGLYFFAAFPALTLAARSKISEHAFSNSSMVAGENGQRGNLCEQSLIISYKQSEHSRNSEGLWILEPGWEDVLILEKKTADDCVRSYKASCTKGMIVTKICKQTEGDAGPDYRCLGGDAGDCGVFTINSRGTDVQDGETEMIVHDPEDGDRSMKSGRVSWEVRDMSKSSGVTLESINKGPGSRGSWSAASGCYCCKHSYPLLHSPFCYQSSLNREARVAWNVKDGTQECMNAWQYIGEDDGLMLIPDVLYSLVDVFSLGITSSSACALACAARDKTQFPEHSHYYKKSVLSDSSCA